MKKTAVITTTINVPFALESYSKLLPEKSMIFVTGDMKTPEGTERFCNRFSNIRYIGAQEQKGFDYASSEFIGWNCIQRRNIALLEAIKWGADMIITIDDDNIPVNSKYWSDFAIQLLIDDTYAGLSVSDKLGYVVNPLHFFDDEMYHRGYPFIDGERKREVKITSADHTKVGVCAGLWYGDPDIDSVNRMATTKKVYNIPSIYDSGFIVELGNFSPFNSQNTAYVRELAPLMCVYPGVGRYDDIWSSYVSELVMHDLGYAVHYGKPYVFQERNSHNQFNDLSNEMIGMKKTEEFLQYITNMNKFMDNNIRGVTNKLYALMGAQDFVSRDFIRAWIKDVEGIM